MEENAFEEVMRKEEGESCWKWLNTPKPMKAGFVELGAIIMCERSDRDRVRQKNESTGLK